MARFKLLQSSMFVAPLLLVGIVACTASLAAAIPLIWAISLEKRIRHQANLLRLSERERVVQHQELVRWRNLYLDDGVSVDVHSRKTQLWKKSVPPQNH